MTGEPLKNRAIALPAIRRFPLYLNALERLRRDGATVISTTALSQEAGVSDPVVKKDLNTLGAPGRSGVGYSVEPLIDGIRSFLGWETPRRAVVAGVGNLGTALMGHSDFQGAKLSIVAAFDSAPERIGTAVHGIKVFPIDGAAQLIRLLRAEVGIITVPDEAAQRVADIMTRAGITSIWSFSEQVLSVPPDVTVQREILSAGLAELLVRSSWSGAGHDQAKGRAG
ncbi:MAG: redox-sensing transcriptional repressor Rex [Planctomycetes bacterium]|nr:redox-sensing transcriptional repressor Rex [Planctomycetota bacterium]